MEKEQRHPHRTQVSDLAGTEGRGAGDIVRAQAQWFRRGLTLAPDYRIAALKRLRRAVLGREAEMYSALAADLGKPRFEAVTSELFVILKELDQAIAGVPIWSSPKRVSTSWLHFPSSSRILPEPLGTVLIVGPWNFPFQLNLMPLIGAIAAGNCCLVKPSEYAPASNRVLSEIIRAAFPEEHCSVIEGGADTVHAALGAGMDFVFFTGGIQGGREVMRAAAERLTPVLLELGGKNPCLVCDDADIALAAKRIAWGRFLNAGQTCVAPDFVLVPRKSQEAFIEALIGAVRMFYGPDPEQSPDFARIVDARHVRRLAALMGSGRIRLGGHCDECARYVAPTLLDGIGWDDPVMREEIFGPILPVIAYDTWAGAMDALSGRPDSLAGYVFGNERRRLEEFTARTRCGAVGINETVSHFLSEGLPFGGRGASGWGKYHGEHSFRAFSHYKSVFRRSVLFDLPLRYPPYGGRHAWIRKLGGL